MDIGNNRQGREEEPMTFHPAFDAGSVGSSTADSRSSLGSRGSVFSGDSFVAFGAPRRMLHRPTAEGRRGSTDLRAGANYGPPSPPPLVSDCDRPLPSFAGPIKVFILLLRPSDRIFELIQVVYYSYAMTVADLLRLIPENATDERLGKQVHVGLCRPKDDSLDSIDLDLLISSSRSSGVDCGNEKGCVDIARGEVLVAVPEGYSPEEVRNMSKNIFQNKKMTKLLRRTNPLAPQVQSGSGTSRAGGRRSRGGLHRDGHRERKGLTSEGAPLTISTLGSTSTASSRSRRSHRSSRYSFVPPTVAEVDEEAEIHREAMSELSKKIDTIAAKLGKRVRKQFDNETGGAEEGINMKDDLLSEVEVRYGIEDEVEVKIRNEDMRSLHSQVDDGRDNHHFSAPTEDVNQVSQNTDIVPEYDSLSNPQEKREEEPSCMPINFSSAKKSKAPKTTRALQVLGRLFEKSSESKTRRKGGFDFKPREGTKQMRRC